MEGKLRCLNKLVQETHGAQFSVVDGIRNPPSPCLPTLQLVTPSKIILNTNINIEQFRDMTIEEALEIINPIVEYIKSSLNK